MGTGTALGRLRVIPFVVAAVALTWAGSALAAIATWTGAGADANWMTAANWGGTAPSAGDDLVFPGGAARLTNTNNFPSGTNFNTITFNGASGGYTLNGNAIQLSSGLTASNTSGTNIVAVPIVQTDPQTFSCTTPGPDRLVFNGGIDLGTDTLTVVAATSSLVLVAGVGISGTGGVTIASGASGVVAFDAANTYTGPTDVQGGFFIATSLSTASVVTVESGATMQFANGNSAGPVTANGGATILCAGGTTQIGNVTNLTLQSTSTLHMVMYGTTNYGQLNASGNVSLNGATLNVTWNAFTSSVGQGFTLINKTSGGAVTGTFNGLAEGATFTGNGRTYRITYVGGDGNDVVITDVTGQQQEGEAIPAATGLGLAIFAVLLAAGGLFVLRRYLA